MAMKELENLKNDYQDVFDEKGNVKACGRTLCQRLMYTLKKFRPNAELGNLETGVMNVEVVKNVYRDIVG
jgi:hypothetical protein